MSALSSGRPEIAQTQFTHAISGLDASFPCRRARFLTLLAIARLRLGELDGACHTATEAVDLIRGVEAERVHTLLIDFRRALEPHATATVVSAFATATADVLRRNATAPPQPASVAT